jgi:hypothetical protein
MNEFTIIEAKNVISKRYEIFHCGILGALSETPALPRKGSLLSASLQFSGPHYAAHSIDRTDTKGVYIYKLR